MNIKANTENNIGTTKLVFFSLTLIILVVALASMPRVTFPLIVSFILSLILKPIVPIFRKLGLSKGASIFVIFIAVGFFLIFPMAKLIPTLQDEFDNFQYYIPKVEQLLETNYSKIQQEALNRAGLELPDGVVDDFLVFLEGQGREALLKIPKILASLLEWLLLIPLFLFFLMRDGRELKNKFLKFVPNQIFERAYFLVYQFNSQIGDYIFAKFVEAAIVGIIIGGGLLIMDVRFALLLGLAAAVTNIIPYIGPIIGIIPGLVVGFIDFGMGPEFGAVVILYSVANAIDLALVFPILVSKIVNIHPVLVVVSVIIGSQYMGVVGMIVSIPLAASLKLLFSEVYKDIFPESTRDL